MPTADAPLNDPGSVMGDLSSRGGKVLGMTADGPMQVIQAEVAQRAMHAYATDLSSLTGGRGEHSEEFSRYEEMPKNMEAKVIAEFKGGGNGD